jgi:hypothetical protein
MTLDARWQIYKQYVAANKMAAGALQAPETEVAIRLSDSVLHHTVTESKPLKCDGGIYKVKCLGIPTPVDCCIVEPEHFTMGAKEGMAEIMAAKEMEIRA